MGNKIIQISIAELLLDERGPNDDKEDINLFRISLSYPFEGVPGIETVKTIQANKPLPSDWASDFDKAIVFKTELIGKAKLSVEAASIDIESKSDKLIRGLFKSLFGAVLGVWTGGFGSPYVGAITKTVGTSLVDMVDDEDDIDIIGKAETMIDSENLVSSIELPLEVKKAVTKKKTIRNPERGSAIKRVRVDQVVIPAGQNGKIKLNIDILN